MDIAKTRKNGGSGVSRHLVSSARQAITRVSQTVIAKALSKPDSTIMRRTERLEDDMEILAEAGITDFVFHGEKKIPIDEYRWLLRMSMELARIQLDMTNADAGFAA